jgi:hypothetical protein
MRVPQVGNIGISADIKICPKVWRTGIMFGWIVRLFLIVVGFVASLFVARDAPQFGLVQMVVGLFFAVLVVAVLAFWPERWTHILNRLRKPR